MKLIAVGVGGSGAACVECLVHLTALGILPSGVDLVPVILDPDQDHPRIQSTSRFIASYAMLRERGGASDLAAGGLLGNKIARVVNTNTLKPSEKTNLFSLLGLSQPIAKSLATLFFTKQELGGPGSNEFGHGYYGRVNAGVCFFNDPEGRQQFMQALGAHVLGGNAAIALIGSAFGGTGAAGLIHLARVFKEDPGLQHVPFGLAAVQLEPYFRPDHRGDALDAELVNIPDTFSGRTGAALQFMARLADDRHLPFDALYPLGVSEPTTFPPDWFKKDGQNNPHLFVEYLAALAVRDFAINYRNLSDALRHRRAAVPPFEGPLAVFRESLYDALALRVLLRTYVHPLLQTARKGRLPGHPWVAEVCAASGLSPTELAAHFTSVCELLDDILIAAGVDRAGALERAGRDQIGQATAGRRVELTRASFPTDFAPRAESYDLVRFLQHGPPTTCFATYEIGKDNKLPARALYRWIAQALHPERGSRTVPALEAHVGEKLHQWTQQPGGDHVLGINVPADDNFQTDPIGPNLRLLAGFPAWRAKRSGPITAGEYPTIWAPALVHRDELYRKHPSEERRHLELGLLGYAVLRRFGLHTPPVRVIDTRTLTDAFQQALKSTFPLAGGQAAIVCAAGVLAIYDSQTPLDVAAVPRPDDIVGFFYPDTVVVPAAGIANDRLDRVVAFGELLATQGFPQALHAQLADDWTHTLAMAGVPKAEDKGEWFINFLSSFDPPVSQDIDLSDRYDSLQIPGTAAWVNRLYKIN